MRCRFTLLTCVLVLFVTAESISAQGPPRPPSGPPQPRDAAAPKTGTAKLAGRVTSLETGRPIRRAVVRASGSAIREGRSVSTDADGRWELREIPAGRFNIFVSKGGFVPLMYGQQRPFEPGKTVDVADGASVHKLDVALPRGGAIAGRVVDELGEPVTAARVMPFRYRYVNGRRQLSSVDIGDMTDDLGQYRLFGLPPGDYYIAAQSGGITYMGTSEDRTGYPRTFYPAASTVSEAFRVTVSIGQEAQNIVISLAPSRIVNISGTVTMSDGKPVKEGVVVVRETKSEAETSSLHGMIQDGTWTVNGFAPGTYQLRVEATDVEAVARAGSTRGVRREFATRDVTVSSEDITGIALVTTSGNTVSGRIRFDGGKSPASPSAHIALVAFDENGSGMPTSAGPVKPDWTFEMRDIGGRRRLMVVELPTGWTVKAIMHDNIDITDTGIDLPDGKDVSDIDVVLTNQAPELAGTVLDVKGATVHDFAVVLFAADPQRWGWQSRFVRVARPDQNGRFVSRGVPAGSYLAVALEYVEPGQETDPEFLERLKSLATPIRLVEGDKKTITLKLSSQ